MFQNSLEVLSAGTNGGFCDTPVRERSRLLCESSYWAEFDQAGAPDETIRRAKC